MIIKSYLLEQDIKLLSDKNLFLFYGENLGLKNDFKNLIKLNSPDYKIININQDEVIKNQENFLSEFLNFSLFEKKKIYYIKKSKIYQTLATCIRTYNRLYYYCRKKI